MTVILRLQGLDVKASAEDIRTFFKCLRIPDGGVYIVGGSLKEAFIAFTTERDAQIAMRYTGNVLKGSVVTLDISSMEELEHKLMSFLKRKKLSPAQVSVKRPRPSQDADLPPLNACPQTPSPPPPAAWNLDHNAGNLSQSVNAVTLQASNALDCSTAFLLGVCTVLQGLQSSNQRENSEAVPRVDFTKTPSTPDQTPNSRSRYVRLFGLPASATKEVICHFFSGLTVQEVIVNVKMGFSHGCLVKFSSVQDAQDALLFNRQSLGSICVEVRRASEEMWTSALQECEHALEAGESVKPKQSPLKETVNHKQKSTFARQMKRGPKSRQKPRPDSKNVSSPAMEYTIMVRNLPKTMTKTELKQLFGCPNIAHKNVLHLLDKKGNRTDTAFLTFNRTEDYEYALNLSGCHVGSDTIEVSSVTKKIMRDMMV